MKRPLREFTNRPPFSTRVTKGKNVNISANNVIMLLIWVSILRFMTFPLQLTSPLITDRFITMFDLIPLDFHFYSVKCLHSMPH